jgi:glycosyltransferase involved in cell wall biosynthesis
MDSDTTPLIVHVVNSFEGGGMERTLRVLLQRGTPSHFRHAIITLRRAGDFCRTLPDDVRVHELGIRGASRFSFLRLARVLRKWRPAAVHARGAGCWSDTVFASAIAGRPPMILGFHGIETGRGFTPNQRRAARVGQRLGATFTSVSRAGREMMKDTLRLPQESIEHLPNGVDANRFASPGDSQRNVARTKMNIPPSAFVIGTVASMTSVKRHDLMIDAVADMQESAGDVRLLIVGSGSLRARLAEHATRRGVSAKIQFVGQREDVTPAYHAIDAYLCASDSEGVSNSVLEAMACGVPVITTNVGDHGILVRDGIEGVVVEAGSASALARGMNRIFLSPAARNSMGQAARRRVASMSLGDMLSRYEQLYQRRVFTDCPKTMSVALAG